MINREYISAAIFNFEECFGPHHVAIAPDQYLIVKRSKCYICKDMRRLLDGLENCDGVVRTYSPIYTYDQCDYCHRMTNVCDMTYNDELICEMCYKIVNLISNFGVELTIAHLGKLIYINDSYNGIVGIHNIDREQSKLREYEILSAISIIIDAIICPHEMIHNDNSDYRDLDCEHNYANDYYNKKQLIFVGDIALCQACYHNINLCHGRLMYKLFLTLHIANNILLPIDISRYIFKYILRLLFADHGIDHNLL